jgi:hypothetical protein
MAERIVPAYVGWDAFNAAERKMYQRGKTHAACVVIDEQGVAIDIGGGTSAHTRESLGALAPSYQFPPVAAVIDGHRIVRWLGRGAVTAALVAAKEDQP